MSVLNLGDDIFPNPSQFPGDVDIGDFLDVFGNSEFKGDVEIKGTLNAGAIVVTGVDVPLVVTDKVLSHTTKDLRLETKDSGAGMTLDSATGTVTVDVEIKTDILNSKSSTSTTINSVIIDNGQINTGQGLTEVYLMDQDVETKSNVEFANILTNTITEATLLAGVTIEGVKLEDSKIEVDDGTFALPSYSFTNETSTGIYRDATYLSFTKGGFNKMQIGATDILVGQALSMQGFQLRLNGTQAYMVGSSPNRIDLYTNSSNVFSILDTYLLSNVPIQVPAGLLTAVGTYFSNSTVTNTGFYSSADGAIDFGNKGTRTMTITPTLISPRVDMQLSTYLSWTIAPAIRMYCTDANTLCVANFGVTLLTCWSTVDNTTTIFGGLKTNNIRSITAVPLLIGSTTSTQVDVGAIAIPTNIKGNLTAEVKLTTDTIVERTLNNGVQVEALLLKDNTIDTSAATSLDIGRINTTIVRISKAGVPTWIEGQLVPKAEVLAINGTAAAPGYSFDADSKSGMWWNDGVAISYNSSNKIFFKATATEMYQPLSVQTIDVYAPSGTTLAIAGTSATVLNLASTTCLTEVKGDLKYQSDTGGSYMTANATATVLTVSNPNLIAGASVNMALLNDVKGNNLNRLTYTGTRTKYFNVMYSCSLLGASNETYVMMIYKNGALVVGSKCSRRLGAAGDIGALSANFIVQLATNEYVELYVQNITTTASATIQECQFIITEFAN